MKVKLLAIAAAIISPIQLTIAELKDKYDESATTVFQPDLVISAWGSWLVISISLLVGANALLAAKEAKQMIEDQTNNLNEKE